MDISGHMTDVETPKCLQERQVDEYRIQKSKIIVILEYIDEIRKSYRHSGLSWDCNHQVEENFYATHVQPEVLSNLVALCFWSCWDRAIYHIPNIFEKKTTLGSTAFSVPALGFPPKTTFEHPWMQWWLPERMEEPFCRGCRCFPQTSLSWPYPASLRSLYCRTESYLSKAVVGRKSTVSCFAADMTMKLQEMKSKTKQLEQAPSKSEDVFTAHTLMWDDHRVFRAQWMAWFHADAFCHICFPSMRSYTVRSSCNTFWNYELKLPRAAFGVQIKATCCQETDNGTIGCHMIPGRQW